MVGPEAVGLTVELVVKMPQEKKLGSDLVQAGKRKAETAAAYVASQTVLIVVGVVVATG